MCIKGQPFWELSHGSWLASSHHHQPEEEEEEEESALPEPCLPDQTSLAAAVSETPALPEPCLPDQTSLACQPEEEEWIRISPPGQRRTRGRWLTAGNFIIFWFGYHL
jgi:hypothetical protein